MPSDLDIILKKLKPNGTSDGHSQLRDDFDNSDTIRADIDSTVLKRHRRRIANIFDDDDEADDSLESHNILRTEEGGYNEEIADRVPLRGSLLRSSSFLTDESVEDREQLVQQALDREMFGGPTRAMDRPPSPELLSLSQNQDQDNPEEGALFSDSDDEMDASATQRQSIKRQGKRRESQTSLNMNAPSAKSPRLSQRPRRLIQDDDDDDDDDELLQWPGTQTQRESQESVLTAPDPESQELSDITSERPPGGANNPKQRRNEKVPAWKVPSSRKLMEEKKKEELEKMKMVISVNKQKRKNITELTHTDYKSIPPGNYRTARTANGERLYFPLKSRRTMASAASASTQSSRKDLLSINIHVMLKYLEAERALAAEEESIPSRFSRFAETSNSHTSKEQLWVDKYAPRMYIDLLGDEILLLAGPAGLGKTTLAHVVGRHAGYNVLEINASDDRTGTALREKLLSAIESKSIISNKPNLVIIDEIDGASATGGDNSFMKLLVDLAQGDAKEESGNNGEAGSAQRSRKKNGAKRQLLRPIICICNDLYAPVLRPLRAVAQVYVFRTPPLRLLAQRLTEICRWEGLQADFRAIMGLCELTDGDIRSCLNTLQFIRKRSHTLSSAELASIDVGHKDMSRGLFKVWESIFTTPSARDMKKMQFLAKTSDSYNGYGKKADGDASRYMNRLLDLIASSGEVEKILQGCYENYLKMRIIDSAVQTTATGSTKAEQAMDWLLFYDKMDRRINMMADFELMRYQPLAIVNFHRLFATTTRPTIDFPRADYDAFVAKKTNENIIVQFMATLSPAARSQWGSRERLTTELVSPLLQITSPNFRPINLQLMKPDERAVLDQLVSTMVFFGLRFVQEKGEDGHYLFRLDPSIEKLLMAGKSGSQDVHSQHLAYPVRQLISSEIQSEMIRRSDVISKQRQEGLTRLSTDVSPNLAEKENRAPKAGKAVAAKSYQKRGQNNLAITKMGPIDLDQPVAQMPINHFAVKADNNLSNIERLPEPLRKSQISFKFNEGFSNAVRKPVLMRDLL
ncbi:Chromosome transmission fidelity protein 18 [Chytridiales sp. JEL 0842]|nr:Chromosome transmission fidelity protein 18 [Chytridiales sp. JEL 0842]